MTAGPEAPIDMSPDAIIREPFENQNPVTQQRARDVATWLLSGKDVDAEAARVEFGDDIAGFRGWVQDATVTTILNAGKLVRQIRG